MDRSIQASQFRPWPTSSPCTVDADTVTLAASRLGPSGSERRSRQIFCSVTIGVRVGSCAADLSGPRARGPPPKPWRFTGLLVAATNHEETLDRGLWRRFDEVVEFPLPTVKEIRTLLRRGLKHLKAEPLPIDGAS